TWDPATGRHLRTFDRHIEWVQSAEFSPDGRRIASAAVAPPIMVWDADTLQVAKKFEWAHFPDCLALSPDGRLIAVGRGTPQRSSERTGIVQGWDVESGREVTTYRGHAGGVFGVAFSPDGKAIASVGGDRQRGTGEVKVWDVATGRDILAIPG